MSRDGMRTAKTLALALILATGGVKTTPAEARDWQDYHRHGGCVGGRECSPRPLEVPLEDRPVLRVRFIADPVRSNGDGRLRVTLDGQPLDRELVLGRRGRTFELDADGSRGRFLRFEASGADAVDIRSIEVLYGDRRSADPRRNGAYLGGDSRLGEPLWRDDGWASYRNERGCIGGKLCDGDNLRIRLLHEPVERLRFFAHDELGKRHRGQLRVYLDSWVVANRLDIERQGRTYDLEVAGRRGDYLIFEALANDEVMIEDIQVLYRGARRRTPKPRYQDRTPSRYRYGYDGPGECIGGDLCGRRHRFDLVLDGLPIDAVRFHAHSDVGERAEGRLRVLLDRDIIEEELEIPRRGDFYQIELDNARGRLLTFEAIDRAEVVVEDIEVRYEGKAWTRHRVEEEKPQ